jgi:DNA-binding response OmpR family regulator
MEDAKKTLVLVVEDDVAFQGFLKEALELNGFAVLCANNGEEALDLLGVQKPDVILTDIVMPRKDGIELIRTLRTEAPEARLIAMSGGGVLGHQDYYMELSRVMGVHGTLTKPFHMEQLLELLKSVLAN